MNESTDVRVNDAPGERERSLLRRHGLDWHDAFTLILAGLFPVAFFPPFVYETWTPRLALLVLALPYGLVCLIRLVKLRDTSAAIAAALAAWFVLASLVGPNPMFSLFGSQGRSSSAMVVTGYLALWAIARLASEAARRLMVPVLVVAVGASALIGLLQPSSGPLASVGGRVYGLAANPVYLAALSAGLAVICLSRLALKTGWSAWAFMVLMFSFTVGMASSRVAIGGLIIGTILVVWRAPRSLVMLQLLALPLIGLVAASRMPAESKGSNLLRTGGSNRLEVWRYGWSAFRERPVFGWGPGNFRTGIQGYFTEDFSRSIADPTRQPWWESHNILVQTSVLTGVVGVSLLIGFVIVAGRTARGPLALGALTMAVSFLFQPTSIHLAPTVLLALGAAMPPPDSGASLPVRPQRVFSAGAMLVGAVFSSVFVVGDLVLAQALKTQDVDTIVAVADTFFYDPDLANVAASFVEASGASDDELISKYEEVVDREPEYAYWQNRLANRYRAAERFEEMDAVLDKVLENEPTNRRGWVLRVLYAQSIGDEALEAEAKVTACRLGAALCRSDEPDEAESD